MKFDLSLQIHPELFQLHAMFSTLVPTFGICSSWHLPRKGYKNPKKYDGPLDTGNQHSDAFELFCISPFSVHRHVYDAPVSDRVVQVLLAVVKFMTLQWSNFELGKGMAATYFTPHNMYVMLMTMTHHLWKIRWCESRSVQGWKIKSALL